MQDWYDYFVKQDNSTWWPLNEQGQFDYALYPQELARWDQFTLWWLTEKVDKYKELKVGIFEDDLKWNYWALLDRVKHPMADDVVIHHLSCQANKGP